MCGTIETVLAYTIETVLVVWDCWNCSRLVLCEGLSCVAGWSLLCGTFKSVLAVLDIWDGSCSVGQFARSMLCGTVEMVLAE